jgi:hypothetical protein
MELRKFKMIPAVLALSMMMAPMAHAGADKGPGDTGNENVNGNDGGGDKNGGGNNGGGDKNGGGNNGGGDKNGGGNVMARMAVTDATAATAEMAAMEQMAVMAAADRISTLVAAIRMNMAAPASFAALATAQFMLHPSANAMN